MIKLINISWIIWFIFAVGFNSISTETIEYKKDNTIDTIEQVKVRIMPACHCPKHCTVDKPGHVTINHLVEADAPYPLYGYIQGLLESGNYPAGGKKSFLAKYFNNAFGMSLNNRPFNATAEEYYKYKDAIKGKGNIFISSNNKIYYKSSGSKHKRAIYTTKLNAAKDLAAWQRKNLKSYIVTNARQYIEAVMANCYLGCGEKYAKDRQNYINLYLNVYNHVKTELGECSLDNAQKQKGIGWSSQ